MNYIVKETRDATNTVLNRDIVYYSTKSHVPESHLNDFITFTRVESPHFENPILVETPQVGGPDLLTIINDPAEDMNDALWDTMEKNIRDLAQLKMGVDDDSNLVASDRDIVKLLNTAIFQFRLDRPNEFTSDGLLAHVDTASFTTSDALDTANKMRNFYREVMRELHDSVIGERDTFIDNRT